MTTYVRAREAARQLGVSTATLYSYVSRGRVTRTLAADGRSSLFDLAELESLRSQNRRAQPPPPTIDVRIASAVTQLSEKGLRYRDVPVDDLVERPFEAVCALLWQVPDVDLVDPADEWGGSTAGRLDNAGSKPVMALIELVSRMDLPDDPFDAAQRLLGSIPRALGGAVDHRMAYAERLVRTWTAEPSIELVDAVNTSLVLLADHELATSTLAVRVAASVRASPASAIIAGLATIDGNLHGSAANHVHQLLVDCERDGTNVVLQRCRDERRRVPGFGHTIYRDRDPRFDPLLERVRRLPDPDRRWRTVSELVTRAGGYVTQLPNVDLAMGALTFVAGLPPDCPLFAVARIAGFAAHYREELDERPVRYRGLSY
jgi:citrate synthase